ncbi:MAG: hypothetical protein AAF960_01695 [Bacteroidota bacterium]
MSLLTQYRERLHLKDAVKDLNKRNSSGNFTGTQSVGFLLNATDKNDWEIVTAYINQLKKQTQTIQVLAFEDTKECTEDLPFDVFCKKDLDWLWRPKEAIQRQFKQHQFDLLINCSQTDCFPLEYLAVSANANYKIGALTDYPNNYDLMLEAKSIDKYLEQVDFFIKKFSNT